MPWVDFHLILRSAHCEEVNWVFTSCPVLGGSKESGDREGDGDWTQEKIRNVRKKAYGKSKRPDLSS